MKKLLILGTSNGSCEIVRYAKSQGIYTIVTDNYAPAHSMAKTLSDEYWMVSTGDLDLLEKKCRHENVSAVISGASDFNMEMSIELSSRLNLSSLCTAEAWHYSKDKSDFKQICRKYNAPIPTDYHITDALTESEMDEVVFPVIVKPVDMSGNKGVSYCYDKNDLIQAYKFAQSVSKNSKIIVERMLHGEEWYASYAVAKGKVRLIALNAMYSQPGEPKNCYTITTTVSKHVEQFLHEINPAIEKVLQEGVGCTEGYCWVQVMLDEDGHFYIIEMGYRLDGDMMFVPYRDVCHFDTVKFLVDYLCGIEDNVLQLPEPQTKAYQKCGCGMMLWTNKDGIVTQINGIDRLDIPGAVIDFRLQIGDKIGKYTSLGNILFTTDNCEQMCEMIDKVNKTVSIINERGEDVVIKYTNFDYLENIYQEGLEGK